MSTRIRWTKTIEITFDMEVDDADAELARQGDADVLAEYENDDDASEYAVTERDVVEDDGPVTHVEVDGVVVAATRRVDLNG